MEMNTLLTIENEMFKSEFQLKLKTFSISTLSVLNKEDQHSNFKDTIQQHNIYAKDIKNTVHFIEPAIMYIVDYFNAIEQNKNDKIKKLKIQFESIGPILIKLETLILGTYTGHSDCMQYYYAYWEKQLFELLIRYR